MQTSSRLEELFQRWFNGQANPAEKEELINLLESIDINGTLPAVLKAAWDDLQAEQVYTNIQKDAIVDKILQKARPPLKTRTLNHSYWWWAAAMLCIIMGAGYWLNSRVSTRHTGNAIATTKDVPPGRHGAVLTLANGKKIVLDSSGNGIITNQQGTQVILSNGKLLYNATKAEGVSYNNIYTPRGRKFQLVLPDNSKVWLNAGSSLQFPTAFTDKERLVKVTGEAYFEIAKDPARPFCVSVNDRMQVKVLGTSFNVNAYGDEASMNTTLLNGAVLIETPGHKPMQLNPGQQVRAMPDGTLQMESNVNTDQVIAWKDGYFNFDGATIQQVMRQLARWYDIEIVYEGKIPDIIFEGELPTSLQLSQVLKILNQVEIKYRIEGKRLIILP